MEHLYGGLRCVPGRCSPGHAPSAITTTLTANPSSSHTVYTAPRHHRYHHASDTSIRATSTSSPPNLDPHGAIPDAKYFGWAAEQGIQAPNLDLAVFPGGLRGVRAARPIAQEDVLVSVPRRMALVVTPQMPCPCPDLLDKGYWQRAPWFCKMAILVLLERRRGASSPLVGYMQHLPATLDLPMAWTDADLQQLHFPPLKQQVQQQRSNWHRFHQELTAGLQPGQSVPWEDFVWALQAVRSRCFSGPYSGSPLSSKLRVGVPTALAASAYVLTQDIPLEQALNGAIAVLLFNLLYDVFLSQRLKWYAMCPVIDSINHDSASNNTVSYEYFRDTFAVAASSGVELGEQVYITYGSQSNDSLLQYYGFVEQSNPHDTYTIEGLADKLGVPGVEQWRARDPSGAAMLDAAVLTRQGLDAATMHAVEGLVGSAAGARQALARAVAAELNGLPTTQEQDKQALEEGRRTMDERMRLALLFRIEKKGVLRQVLEQM